MACYDFDYVMQMLRQAVVFAEVEHDFAPLRKWVNEIAQSGREKRTIETRLNANAGQEFLLAPLQAIAVRSLAPEEARKFLATSEPAPGESINTEDGHLEADYEDRVSGLEG